MRSPFEHWSCQVFTFPAWVLRSFMNSLLMSSEITLLCWSLVTFPAFHYFPLLISTMTYDLYRDQDIVFQKHPPFDMNEVVKKLHYNEKSFTQVSSSFFWKTVLLDNWAPTDRKFWSSQWLGWRSGGRASASTTWSGMVGYQAAFPASFSALVSTFASAVFTAASGTTFSAAAACRFLCIATL